MKPVFPASKEGIERAIRHDLLTHFPYLDSNHFAIGFDDDGKCVTVTFAVPDDHKYLEDQESTDRFLTVVEHQLQKRLPVGIRLMMVGIKQSEKVIPYSNKKPTLRRPQARWKGLGGFSEDPNADHLLGRPDWVGIARSIDPARFRQEYLQQWAPLPPQNHAALTAKQVYELYESGALTQKQLEELLRLPKAEMIDLRGSPLTLKDFEDASRLLTEEQPRPLPPLLLPPNLYRQNSASQPPPAAPKPQPSRRSRRGRGRGRG